MKAIILSARSRIGRSSLRRGFLLIPVSLVLVGFALCRTAQAVTPAPDGGYAGNNTAEGTSSLLSLTSGTNNTANGFQALYHDTTGSNNTAVGTNALFNNTTGNFNLANGVQALFHNTSGSYNMANGIGALFSNATGDYNVATGLNSLFNNTTGVGNTAHGISALFSNTGGNNNTATGWLALNSNVSGDANTATGVQALNSNTSGNNTANGFQALFSNTSGSYNTANGIQALYSNVSGHDNTATGDYALYNNTAGDNNTASGRLALYDNTTGSQNTAYGLFALENTTSGNNNIALGANAGINLTVGDNNIDIGNTGVAGESGIIRIGTDGTHTDTFLAGSVTLTGSGNVRLNGGDFRPLGTQADGVRWVDESGVIQAHIHRYGAVDNRLYFTNNGSGNLTGVYLAQGATSFTSTSDERLKSDVEPISGILEKIKDIRVVSFNMATLSADPATGEMKVDRNPPPRTTRDGTVIKDQIGTMAQDWIANFPELVVEPQADNQYYGLAYDRIGIIALGAIKELSSIVSQKDTEIARLAAKLASITVKQEALIAQQQKDFQATIAQQQKQIEALTVGLQKVTAQLESSKPATRVVTNAQ